MLKITISGSRGEGKTALAMLLYKKLQKMGLDVHYSGYNRKIEIQFAEKACQLKTTKKLKEVLAFKDIELEDKAN